MKEKVLVKISGMQFPALPTEASEDIEVRMPGRYRCRDGCHFLLFDEAVDDSGDTVRNLVRIEEDRVTIRKSGMIMTEMEFIRGEERLCEYTTPFGSFILGIMTEDLVTVPEEDRLTVQIRYTLEINHEYSADCHIRIEACSGR